MRWVPDRWSDPPEKPVHSCDGCHDDLTNHIYFAEGVMCSDCFKEYVRAYYPEYGDTDLTLPEIADELGIEHKELEDYEYELEQWGP